MAPRTAPCPHPDCLHPASPCMGRRLLAGFGVARMRSTAFGLLLAGCFLLGLASISWAASASTAPHTGLEGGHGRSYGPDVEKRSGNNVPQTSMPMDAYGNPITGEIQEAAPRQRPRAGAYGGYGKQSQGPSRPLPSPPAKPKWGFD